MEEEGIDYYRPSPEICSRPGEFVSSMGILLGLSSLELGTFESRRHDQQQSTSQYGSSRTFLFLSFLRIEENKKEGIAEERHLTANV